MKLDGNTLLITGGGSGIGRALAEAFHKLGNTVIISGRTQAKLDETCAANPGMQGITLDVTDPADIQRVAKELPGRFPELNVLINNAGIMRIENLKDHQVKDAEDLIETNLLGPIRLTSALTPHLMAQKSAAVLNVSSGLAFVPMAPSPTYCATKAALHSYSISLREQLADTSVEVIELIPPYVQTYIGGEAQANDPRAQPLADYISDTMTILREQPDEKEVVIERVAPLRTAEKDGTFDELFAMLTAMGNERH